MRLQTLRTNQVQRLINETEQERNLRLQIARDNTARRIEVETNEERQNRLQLLQQNGAMYKENDRLQHQQHQNNRDSYLSNAWRNAEQPLHEQQWVQTEMPNFHRTMNKLDHRRCVTCKEAWPTNNGFTLQIFECLRCKRDKGNPKLLSQESDMDPGSLPTALQGLTDIEEMLIARACPIICVFIGNMEDKGGYKGHVLNLPQDIQGFLSRLPPNVAQLPYLIIRKHGADNTHRDCSVRRQKVLEAITWLKDNNPFMLMFKLTTKLSTAYPSMEFRQNSRQLRIHSQMHRNPPPKKTHLRTMMMAKIPSTVIPSSHFLKPNSQNRMQ